MKYWESKIQAQIIIYFLSRILFDSIYFTFSNILNYEISRIDDSKSSFLNLFSRNIKAERKISRIPLFFQNLRKYGKDGRRRKKRIGGKKWGEKGDFEARGGGMVKRKRKDETGEVDELTRADKARVLSPLGRYRGSLGTRSHPSE